MLKGKYESQASLSSPHVMLKRYTDSVQLVATFATNSFSTNGLSTSVNVKDDVLMNLEFACDFR